MSEVCLFWNQKGVLLDLLLSDLSFHRIVISPSNFLWLFTFFFSFHFLIQSHLNRFICFIPRIFLLVTCEQHLYIHHKLHMIFYFFFTVQATAPADTYHKYMVSDGWRMIRIKKITCGFLYFKVIFIFRNSTAYMSMPLCDKPMPLLVGYVGYSVFLCVVYSRNFFAW